MKDQPTPAELEREIAALSPANKLRLAADMLEAKQPWFALALIKHVAAELEAVLSLPSLPRSKR